MSPSSRRIWSSISASFTGVSSTSSSSTTRCTLPSVYMMPATGPVTGQKTIVLRSPTLASLRSAGFLELQLDVHVVVRRPRPGVLEGEQILVLAAHLAHALVELFASAAIHEEGRVQNHAVADHLVAAARDGHGLARIVHFGDVAVPRLLERGFDQAAELHACEVRRRGGIAIDLVLESADLVIRALDVRDDLVAVPE